MFGYTISAKKSARKSQYQLILVEKILLYVHPKLVKKKNKTII